MKETRYFFPIQEHTAHTPLAKLTGMTEEQEMHHITKQNI